MEHTSTIVRTLFLLALVGCDQSSGFQVSGFQEDGGRLSRTPIAFDVAENMARFSFAGSPVHEDGMPAYGNTFVTQGYLYPLGFLDTHEGTNEDGSPAHPNMVIGEWTCRGVFVGDGAHTQTGPWVITTQLYDFYEESGYARGKASGLNNLVSEGYEIADIDKPVRRAITGGTGHGRSDSRELEQVLLGFNGSEGVNLRIAVSPGFVPMDEQKVHVDPIDGLQFIEAK